MRVHLCLLLCCAVLAVLSFAAAERPSVQLHRHQRSSPLAPPSASLSLPSDYPPSVPPFHPLANPAAVVTVGNARFTVLTSHMIRLEYSASRQFQDAATWVAINRNLTVPPFKVSTNATHTVIATSAITLSYLTAASTTFSSSNIRVEATYSTGLSVELGGSGVQQVTAVWSAINQEETEGNLRGTFRTLDGDSGDETDQLDCKNQNVEDNHCTYGVVSRNGYALIDDSHRPSFDNSDWPWVQPTVWTSPPSDQCQLADADKRDCGYTGIDGKECTMRGCCYTGSEAAAGTPSCFYSTQADQDLYFLGHGHDYKLAIREFTALAGDIPLPPRYTFGIFFSRYWAYASYEEKQIVRDYAQHRIPLDTLVIDMDWHMTFYKQAWAGVQDQSGQPKGWTGFTFDRHLFVNYRQFLAWCKELGLRNTLNLHPASGIQPWEQFYPEMARAMGIDPASGRYVPFNETNKQFESAWMNITLRPLETAGIDLWWLDWQQGEDWVRTIPYFNPTFWLNYVFFTSQHWSVTGHRNALLHRWGGLGNHRYQIGFSGDVDPNWDSLTFQPYFTATAANVGYTFWSHDLGGHTQPSEPELYTRWLQWGCFSPVFRTHCTKDVRNDRRIYTYPWSYYTTLRRFTKLRQSLTPYIYTQARHTHDSSLGLVQPLYYEYPEHDEAYSFSHQYLYGRQFTVNPITAPISANTSMTDWTVWLPPGRWVNFFTGDVVQGPMVLSKNWTLWEVPAYAREGSIIPLLPDSAPPLSQAQVTPLMLRLVAMIGTGLSGSGELYDDAGDSNGYRTGEYSWTRFHYVITDNTTLTFTVEPAVGPYLKSLPRHYDIELRGTVRPVSVTVNGHKATYAQYNDIPLSDAGRGFSIRPENWNQYSYDGNTLSTVVSQMEEIGADKGFDVVVNFPAPSFTHPAIPSLQGTVARFVTAKATLDSQWGTDHTVFQDDYPSLLDVASIGEALTYVTMAGDDVPILNSVSGLVQRACVEVATNISGLAVDVKSQLLAQLCY